MATIGVKGLTMCCGFVDTDHWWAVWRMDW